VKIKRFIWCSNAEAEKEKEINRRDIKFGVTWQHRHQEVGGVVKMGHDDRIEIVE
jgi:hypothetical protein